MFVHFEAQHAVKKVHDLKILQLNKNREHNRFSFETLSLLVFSEAAVFLNFNWVTTPTRSSSTLWLIPAREVLCFFLLSLLLPGEVSIYFMLCLWATCFPTKRKYLCSLWKSIYSNFSNRRRIQFSLYLMEYNSNLETHELCFHVLNSIETPYNW